MAPQHLSQPMECPVTAHPGGMLPLDARHQGAPPEPGPRYILVTDDDPDQRTYLALVIGEAGYPVQTATNGREALEACRRDPPALVVSDVDMPEMDGLSFLLALRSDPNLAELPVLLASASINRATRIAALAGGADDYLDKPVAHDLLLRRIARALGARALRPAHLPERRWQ